MPRKRQRQRRRPGRRRWRRPRPPHRPRRWTRHRHEEAHALARSTRPWRRPFPLRALLHAAPIRVFPPPVQIEKAAVALLKHLEAAASGGGGAAGAAGGAGGGSKKAASLFDDAADNEFIYLVVSLKRMPPNKSAKPHRM